MHRQNHFLDTYMQSIQSLLLAICEELIDEVIRQYAIGIHHPPPLVEFFHREAAANPLSHRGESLLVPRGIGRGQLYLRPMNLINIVKTVVGDNSICTIHTYVHTLHVIHTYIPMYLNKISKKYHRCLFFGGIIR